jgi:predicted N-acetyltransferase YhbS
MGSSVPHSESSGSCLIRPAAKRDLPDIESAVVAAFAQFRAEAPAPLFEAYIEDSRNLAARWDIAEILVAEVDQRIAGTVTFYADASAEGLGLPTGWAGFRTLAVQPVLRGRGIGRSLVEKCVDAADTLGLKTVGIHTASFMRAACSIYEQVGFRRCPEYDLSASAIMGVDRSAGDVAVIAYRLDLAAR